MADNNFKWYVLKAISGKEQKVKEYIEAACKNTELGQYVSQVLIPMEKIVQQRGNKRVIKERNKLPGYVFVEANLVDECYPRLRNVPNVLGFLSDAKSVVPTPVRQSEINTILGNVEEEANADLTEMSFMVGETVKVVDGPFNGFDGEVNEILPEKRKLKVIVTVFGRKTPLELGFNQVVKE
ncbi:MAG: transcription termination/antitermination protein NusG [Paludibacteraceae bacterium]